MLDDSRRDWLKALCARLGCQYVSRPDNRHAKAGNINHALKLLAALPDPPEFISILDADFVPAPHFLKRAMTLFRDKTIGVVQTPQHFINPDPIQINLGAARFLARRTALFLRHRHAVQGRLVGRVLLRHVVGHPHGAADGDRRVSDRTRSPKTIF